jgi:peptidoglycan/xylan/chitin deacetylase (PgdA/CDA1 family)
MRQRFGKVALSDMYLTGSPHLELQQHSYAHAPFRPLPNVSQPEMTPTQFGLDVIKANRVLNDVLGMTPTGLRTPYGYSYDLFTMPELLNMLRVAGINYVSSHLRSGEDSAVMGPSVAEGQPHTYAGRGYSDIVEVPSHGYQDVVFTEGKKSLIGREAVHTADEIVQHYARLLDNAIEISIIEEDTHVSVALCLHPWAVMEYDPHVEVLMRIVDKARDKGFKVVSYGQMADMYRLAENDQ